MVGIVAPHPSHLTEKDKEEFDKWTGDDIQHAERLRLQKALAYFKNEGFPETASAISARLSELGCSSATDVAASSDTAGTTEACANILSFQEQVKQRQHHTARLSNGVEGLQPPVRSSKESVVGSGAAAATVRRNIKDQGPAAAHRSVDLLGLSDQQLGSESLRVPASGTAPKAAVAATGQQQRAQPMVQEVEARGSKRTQQLLEQNRKLPEADRHAAAETARSRGNDCFRCGAYGDAVEEYTMAIGLHPEQVAYYTNRAAAYLKLKQWEYAAVDATSALNISAAQGLGAADSSLVAKALLRRAEAYMGMLKHHQALQDYEQVLDLLPDEVRAQQGADKARVKLGISKIQPQQQQQQQQQVQQPAQQDVKLNGMRRMAVQECDSSDDEEQEGCAAVETNTCASAAEANGTGTAASQKAARDGVAGVAADVQQPNGQQALSDSIASPPTTPLSTSGLNRPETDTSNAAAAPMSTVAPASFDLPPRLESDSVGISSSESESCDESDSMSETESESNREAAAISAMPSYQQQLDELRMAGNDAYAAGNYRAAIALYQKALLHCPDATAVYVNRSMAHLRMQQYRQAHQDASIAVALDPNNHKAYHKRHQAKQGLEDYQGAIKDLRQCIKLAPRPLQPGLTQELEVLQTTADRAHAAAQAHAAAAHAAGFTDHGSVQIQEEVEDPAEANKRLHDELIAAEDSYGRRAAKILTTAEQHRITWQQHRDQDIQQLQAATAARREARQQAKHEARAARQQARAVAKQHKVEARRQAKAAAAAARPASPAPTKTPTSTPADTDAASMPEHPPPAPSAVLDSITAQVNSLKDQGNRLMAAGDDAAAEAAYMEALQLDGDNVKVLLNLAALRLKQHDGAGALRCCEEVLAQQQQQLGQEQILKAQLRRALALELLDDPAAALAELASLCDQLRAAGLSIDAQLAADIERVSAKVQQQWQRQQQMGAAAGVSEPPGSSDSTAAAAVQDKPQEQQQQQQTDAFTGMRASIPVFIESSTESDEEEQQRQQQQEEEQEEPVGSISAEPETLYKAQEQHEQVQQQDVATDSPQEQQQAEPAAVSVLDTSAASSSGVSPVGPSRLRIAVVEESDSDSDVETETESNGECHSVPQQQQLAIGDVEAAQLETADEGTADSEATTGVAPAAATMPTDTQQQQAGMPQTRLKRAHSSGDMSSEGSATPAAGVALHNMDKLLDSVVTSSPMEAISISASSSPTPATEQQQKQGGLRDRTSSNSSSSSPQKQQLTDSSKQQQEWEEQRFAELTAADQKLKLASIMSAADKGSDKGLESIQKALNQLQTAAEQERENGNAAFSKGQLQQALKHYNAALSTAPTDAKSYANRAQVYLKLKRWQHVETDCNTTLLLLKRAAAGSAADVQLRQKCMYRRALAWKELGKLKEAIADVKQLMGENPRDTAVQRLMNDLKQAYAKHLQQLVAQQQQQVQVQTQPGVPGEDEQLEQGEEPHQNKEQATAAPSAAPAASPAAEAVETEAVEPVSQVYRHRILIEETDGSESEEDEQQQPPGAAESTAAPQGEEVATTQQCQQREHPASNGTPDNAAAASTASAAQATDTSKSPAATAAAAAQKAVQHLTQPQQLTAPRTALDFTRVAKMLLAPSAAAKQPDSAQQQHQQLGAYVRLLEPSKYQSVIKRDLSDSVLELLLAGLEVVAVDDPGFVAEALQQLSRVERFGIVLPMAVRKKGVHASLQNMMQQLSAAGEAVDALSKLYRV